MHQSLVASLSVLLALGATAAHALEKREVACQAAIAKAGKAFVASELASRGKCKMLAAKGKSCDPSGRTTANASKLRKVVQKCGGVTLSNLGGQSCAATSADAGALADCLIDGHTAAVATLITQQFGLAGSESEVTLSGTLAQAGSTLLPPAHLVRYRAITTAPVSLAELTLFCVTFAEPPTSASAAVGADGSFSLTLAAVGVPFGCFVVDEATGEQVATVVFRAGGGDSTQVQVDEGGTLVLGTVSLDLGAGEAVVDASGLGSKTTCEAGVTNPVDFTGQWAFACTPGPAGSGYGCPPMNGPGSGPSQVYLHRVPGTGADSQPKYWLGMWDSVDAFRACGQVEGLAATPGGTTTAGGDTLGVPDGPFTFASDADVFAAIDPYTSPLPPMGPGGPPPAVRTARAAAELPPPPGPMSICNSSSEHCSAVQNNDGEPCSEPDPMTPPSCWGRPDFGTQPPTFVNFTDQQCRDLCYTMNLHAFGGGEHGPAAEALRSSGLCVEQAVIDMTYPPGDPRFLQKVGNPLGRHLLDQLTYSCDDAASVVHRFETRLIGLPRSPLDPPGPPTVCHVTQRAEITLKMESATKVLGSYRESAALAPGDPSACTDDSNPQNPIAQMLRNPIRMLFTLSR